MDPLSKSFNPNRQLKEEFVSNLTGSSMLEIASLSAIVPGLLLLRHWNIFNVANAKKNDYVNAGCKDWRKFTVTLAVDFVSVVLPILLIFTVLAEWAHECAICLMLLLLLIISARRSLSSNFHWKEGVQPVSSLRTNISSYRVSVMDLGVGSFVLANALVSRQARGITSKNWKAAIQSISPLILLGLGRLVFTAGVDYQFTRYAWSVD
eukprot:TRINITY_DN23475_c0_g1_i7.p1 TRINITY_DN23475_c0_g1~~TRINITY_DN23475_c0_g1_i7.p1  ORF type:complete len:241 (+),score=46.61 TRINITY_DN23475_c0_g1_i7:100-723(+)